MTVLTVISIVVTVTSIVVTLISIHRDNDSK